MNNFRFKGQVQTKTYKLQFYGRKIGAIGIIHECTMIVEARNARDAKRQVYREFEHIKGGLPGIVAWREAGGRE